MKPPDPPKLSQTELKKAVRPERYAEVLAHLLHFPEADPTEVVRRLGLSPEVWAQADAFWSAELEAGVRRQQRELALQFSTAFARTRVGLAKRSPPLSSIGSIEAAAPAPPTTAATTPQPATLAAALPSFMAGQGPGAPARGDAPAPSVATPPVETSVPSPPPPVPVRPRTMAIPAMSAPEERKVFSEQVAPDVAIHNAIAHAEVTQGPKVAPKVPVGLTEPAQADEIAAIAKRLLPFGGPGRPPAAEVAPAIPLERHASLHVELSLHPDDRAEILARYGLTAEEHARVDAHWQHRLSGDSALRAAWDTACAQYTAWLRRSR